MANKHLRRKIESSDVDIQEYYRNHGNLDDIRVSGIGARTKYQMRLLLEHDFDKAIKILREEQQEQSKRENRWVGRDKSGKRGDSDPSWEGSYRRHEG